MKLTAENLSCERGGRLVFSAVNFAVKDGGFMQITGPNGSGKSSLLRLVAGLSDPASGNLKTDGKSEDIPLAQHCHYIAHADASKSALTVLENLSFWCDFLGGGDTAAALSAMNLKTLATFPVALLSAGQKRRLALARLSLVARKVWLLDEPSVGLDDASQILLIDAMRAHLKNAGIIIAATHVPLGLMPHHTLHLDGAK
jgi:heme exporter protein A